MCLIVRNRYLLRYKRKLEEVIRPRKQFLSNRYGYNETLDETDNFTFLPPHHEKINSKTSKEEDEDKFNRGKLNIKR